MFEFLKSFWFWLVLIVVIIIIFWLFYGGGNHEFIGLQSYLNEQKQDSDSDLIENYESEITTDDSFQNRTEKINTSENHYENICVSKNYELNLSPKITQEKKQDLTPKITQEKKQDLTPKITQEKKQEIIQEKLNNASVCFSENSSIPVWDNLPQEVKRATFSSKGEVICREFMESYYGKKFNKIRPNFLKNPETGRNLELDCYNDELKIAVEYSGKQHYHFPNSFMKNEKDFINQVRRDELKRDLCDLNGIYLITVPYHVKHKDIPNYLLSHIQEYDRLRGL